MPASYAFSDPRLAKLDGFLVEIEEAHERADILRTILCRCRNAINSDWRSKHLTRTLASGSS